MFSGNEHERMLNVAPALGSSATRRSATVHGGKDDLLNSALSHLASAGLVVTELTSRHEDGGSDALIELTGPGGTEQYEVQIKYRVSPGTVGTIQRPERGRSLIITAYVSDSLAELWRHQDIHYVDSAGNMYIRWDALLIDIRGRRRPSTPKPAEHGRPMRAFKSSGLKILFTLLSEPDFVTATYRDIAQASGTSLGTVQWVLTELEDSGYLSSGHQTRELHRANDLFNRWVEAYTFDLWPRLAMARFDAPDPTWWTRADEEIRRAGVQWGGETAAQHLNKRLRPKLAVIYARTVPKRLVLDHRLRKATGEGSVEIRERFWNFEEDPPSLIVPTPLVYADLVASGDPRQLEAASYLRDNDALLRRLSGG